MITKKIFVLLALCLLFVSCGKEKKEENYDAALDEAVENLKRSTRRYAKRQLTWFNKDKRINWIYKDETEDAVKAAISIAEREENYA